METLGPRRDCNMLQISPPAQGAGYVVSFEDIKTPTELLAMLYRVRFQSWCYPQIPVEFLQALEEIMGVVELTQSN